MANSPATLVQIGPEHHGMRMSLDEFATVEGRPGHLYELERGVIQVVDIPGLPHGFAVQAVRSEFDAFRRANPSRISYIAAGSDAAIRMPRTQTERHPDISVYLSEPPDDPQPWEYWIPDIVIEVVSKGGEERDYVAKREDYLLAGVRLYCIFDQQRRAVTVLERHGGKWNERVLGEGDTLTTPLLPGFALRLSDVFA